MARCRHANVVAYLLREGADPLACDWVHMRTCLHYAAMSGQADCLRLLCSANTQVQAKDGFRALRDVVVQDIQVEACRWARRWVQQQCESPSQQMGQACSWPRTCACYHARAAGANTCQAAVH